ncbi:phosphatidylserine/phosphatidylglycerophosphate/cardiolipin synthase family protein [bacterium]|nr:phosphatidylserine/phosphatidylglycerophosphate/cardiolipin synthase family protein [bacterium]
MINTSHRSQSTFQPSVARGASPQETVTNKVDLFDPAQPPDPLRQAFDGITNAGGVAKAQLLQENQSAWNARWKLVEGAKDSITAQYFCWDHDALGMALLGHMFKKARNEEVQIRLMVDSTGDTFGTRGFKSHIGGKDYLQEVVMTGNAEAKVYHPHWKKVIDQALAIGSTAISANNHDKILEVDGNRGITGGRNIGYEYFVHPDDFKGAWRDQDIYFEGKETAHALRRAFDVEYGAPWITQKVRGDLLGNWVQRDLELLGAYKMMDLWLKDKPLSMEEKQHLRSSEDGRKGEARHLMDRALAALPDEGLERAASRRERKSLLKLAEELVGYTELRGSYNATAPDMHDAEVKIIDKTSSVGIGTDELNSTLWNLAGAAQKSIYIENPYVVLSEDMIQGLRQAGERGVQIVLGTNSPASTDSAVTQAFFLRDWPRLSATIPNLTILCASGNRKLHAKTAVIDEQATLVTTYNLDFISQHTNSEVGSVTWSKEFAKETVDGFNQDQADPLNGVVEYKILRDEQGKPIRRDGLPVLDEKGDLVNEPEVLFGPANHLTPDMLSQYQKKVHRWDFLRKILPQLNPVDTFRKH